jgi:DNA polymerase
MVTWSATPFVPKSRRLDELAAAAKRCEGCPLHVGDVQTVFGSGRPTASIMLVGEQPGDQEDRKGAPFVGPAGRVLWRCLEEAGIDRDDVYVTNAVKHFKHTDRGKRRLHKRPTTTEVVACRPWLDAELEAVGAQVIVALGATAARSVFGRSVTIAANRGAPMALEGRTGFVTYHPSAVLRADEQAEVIRAALVEDLRASRAVVRVERPGHRRSR